MVVGRWVTVKDLETDEVFKYKIVGSAEANPAESRISNESPVGQALLGKTPGVIIDVEVFDGILRYELLEVSR